MIGNAAGGEVNALGMAPEAGLFAAALESPTVSRSAWVLQLGQRRVAALNESFGEDRSCNVPYADPAQAVDDLSRSVLVVRSAGNRGNPTPGQSYCDLGWHTLTADSVAKNAIVVGGTLSTDYDYSSVWKAAANWYAACAATPSACVSGPDYSLWPSSARGPTADGRIKPDLVADSFHCSTWWPSDEQPGYAACGAEPSGAPYGTANGTSQAAPVVTGIVALIHQAYADLFGARPTTDMTRSILLHTSSDRGLIGPDYFFGWGSVDAKAAVDHVRSSSANGGTWQSTLSLKAGETREFQFFIDTRPSPAYAPKDNKLRITASWLDPAGSGNGKDLLNDLDILVLDPAGNPLYPYNTPYALSCRAGACDINQVMLPAVRTAANHTDNVEQIVADIPPGSNGVYTLRVSAPSAYGSGTEQSVSLVANHDVFLPSPTATWALCGAVCGSAQGCCSVQSLGSAIRCANDRCVLARPIAKNANFSLKVTGYSEAGLYVVEVFDTLTPAGVTLTDSASVFYQPWVPQADGKEVKQGSSEASYRLPVSGTYRFRGRVRNRVSAYVIGTQSYPSELEIVVK
jgi:hypothetical protein